MNTFEKFCKSHKIDLTEFPELEPVMRNCYRRYRMGQTTDSKTINAAIQIEKRRLADQHEAAESVSVAQLVTSELAGSHKRMGR